MNCACYFKDFIVISSSSVTSIRVRIIKFNSCINGQRKKSFSGHEIHICKMKYLDIYSLSPFLIAHGKHSTIGDLIIKSKLKANDMIL